MKLVVVCAVLTTTLLVVHADFYIHLYDNATEKYLSNIEYGPGDHYMVASKKTPDQFCRFKLVSLGKNDAKVAIQDNAGNDYFCHIQKGNNSVDSNNFIKPDNKPSIDDTCKFEYKLKLDPDNICGTRIALKADNDRYWMVSSENNFIKPLATTPVYFSMIKPTEK